MRKIRDVVAHLEVRDASKPWEKPPPWLTFFFRLGQLMAACHEEGLRACAVVVPPVRSFAAVSAATGAVVGVAMTAEAVPDVESHFRALSSLPHGTSLVVKMGERIYAAKFTGVIERSGASFLRIEYNGMKQLLPKAQCRRAQVGSGGKRSLPKRAQSPQNPDALLIQRALGPHASQFLSVPTVDAVLVGQLSLLEQEITSVEVRPVGTETATATLVDLLRPSRLLPDGGIPRSLVLSDRISEFELPVADTPHVVVFDGGRAFSRYRSEFRLSSWIAILDRCSPTFQEGIDVANQEFATRRGPVQLFDKLDIPSGTELQVFERVR
ncbi:hypothetical protein ABZ570_11315 [Micromonospora sp. NPDC007271]|uniref:hypothetical protein n=1 Tax=Micromonospora sp. NPDC007271 TaxID=3154587 RepID=UPI0033C5AEB7